MVIPVLPSLHRNKREYTDIGDLFLPPMLKLSATSLPTLNSKSRIQRLLPETRPHLKNLVTALWLLKRKWDDWADLLKMNTSAKKTGYARSGISRAIIPDIRDKIDHMKQQLRVQLTATLSMGTPGTKFRVSRSKNCLRKFEACTTQDQLASQCLAG